jgi:hypothetical protein
LDREHPEVQCRCNGEDHKVTFVTKRTEVAI